MLLREKVYSRFQSVPELTMTTSGLCSDKAWRIRLNWALWIKMKIWWKIRFKTVGKKTCTPNETASNPNWILYWYETTIPLLLQKFDFIIAPKAIQFSPYIFRNLISQCMSELMQVTDVSISGKRWWEIRNNHGSSLFLLFHRKSTKGHSFDSRQAASKCEENGNSGRDRDERLYLADLCANSLSFGKPNLVSMATLPEKTEQERRRKTGRTAGPVHIQIPA